MINLTDEQKAQFYKDSTRKELILTTNADWTSKSDTYQQSQASRNNVETLNLYFGEALHNTSILTQVNIYDTSSQLIIPLSTRPAPYSSSELDGLQCIHNDLFICDKSYVKISLLLGVGCGSDNVLFHLNIHYKNRLGDNRIFAKDVYSYANVPSPLPNVEFVMPNDVDCILGISITRQQGEGNFWAYIGNLLIALGDTNTPIPISNYSNYTIYKPNEFNIEDYITFKILNNEDLVSESFSLNESLCSQENLKFGLCESANCKVTTVNNNYQYKNVPFHVFTKVYTPDSNQLTSSDLDVINFAHSTPDFDITQPNLYSLVGTIDTAGKYFGLGMNVSDYSDILRQAEQCYLSIGYRLRNVTVSGTTPSKIDIRFAYRNLGGDFYYTGATQLAWSSALGGAGTRRLLTQYTNPNHRTVTEFSGISVRFMDANDNYMSVTFTAGSLSLTDMIISPCRYRQTEIPWKQFDISKCFVQNNTLDEYVRTHSAFLVPLGKFRVKEIQNQVSQGLMKKNLTLYDDLVDLEQNAFNWYTNYMFCMTTYENDVPVTRYGVEFARQIFSSFYNYLKRINYYKTGDFVDSVNPIVTTSYSTLLANRIPNTINYNTDNPNTDPMDVDNHYIYFGKTTVSNVSSTNLYKVVLREKAEGIWYVQSHKDAGEGYKDKVDSLGRGVGNSGVYINEYHNNTLIRKYVVNNGDYFMISAGCTKLEIWIPLYHEKHVSINSSIDPGAVVDVVKFIEDEGISVYSAPFTQQLTNGCETLYYYGYAEPHKIFDADSSITGRDVVRSLLEVCGCMFRLDRYKGKPEFVYCTKSGLYPSQTLYPADDLYPRVGHDASIYESLYISTQHEDYTIKNYGKIQILKNYSGSDTESNVQWTYTAPNTDNENTYVIDDNIFYSNAELVYEVDNMVDVDNVLANMYERICDMSYTPQITKAVGLPFVECGDRIGVITHFGGFETFVYNRTLKGIQALFDTFESKGDEYISGVNEF